MTLEWTRTSPACSLHAAWLTWRLLKLPGERQYETAEGLAHDFCLCLQGMGHAVATPWEAHAEPEPADSSVGQASNAFDPQKLLLREVNEAGQVTNPETVIQTAGFEIGDHVKRKADGVEGVISSVDANGMVRIQVEGDNRLAKLKVTALFQGEWMKFTPTADPVFVNTLAPHFAKLVGALDDLAKKYDLKEMNMIKLQKEKDAGLAAKVGPMELILTPATGIPTDEKTGCLACFFLVGTTQVEEEANMELTWHKDGDIKVPLLRNLKALNPEDKLVRFVEKKQVMSEALAFSPAKRRRTKS
eukprot:s3914_g3.t1